MVDIKVERPYKAIFFALLYTFHGFYYGSKIGTYNNFAKTYLENVFGEYSEDKIDSISQNLAFYFIFG